MNIVLLGVSIISFLFAAYGSIFVLWKRIEQEHVEESGVVLDRFFQSIVIGVLIGKIAFLLMSLQWPLALAAITQSTLLHFSLPVAFAGTLLAFYRRTTTLFRDRLHVLDIMSPAIAVWFAGIHTRSFLLSVLSLFSVQEMGVLIAPLVLSVISALFFFFFVYVLAQLEQRYRTFTWYRYRRSSAQSGFVTACLLIIVGVHALSVALFFGRVMSSLQSLVEFIIDLLLIVAGFVILYVRSGRWKAK